MDLEKLRKELAKNAEKNIGLQKSVDMKTDQID